MRIKRKWEGERHRERERDRETERQRQTDRQTETETDRQTKKTRRRDNGYSDIEKEKQACWCRDEEIIILDRQNIRQVDMHTDQYKI